MTDWDNEVDVVVLGSGGAGLTAALAAAASGASVEVYEKTATVGGTTAVSGGIVWIPAHRRSPDGELTEADALKYLEAQSLARPNNVVPCGFQQCRHRRRDARQDPRVVRR